MIKIYNTLSGKKEEFVPIEKGRVGMYVCGVTVYDDCHLGHARAGVAFDVIYRYLKYAGYEVVYVRNITDIDDKIIAKANNEGVSFDTITERYIKEFNDDMSLLGLAIPTHEPMATEHIHNMIKVIGILVDKGVAYEAKGDVLYSVRSFAGYGKLSKRKIDELLAGARVEPGENKRDPLDFALWKKSKKGEPKWESPWGPGRPGWHIECSAMAQHYLGDKFDIHGGGKDLVFPHHENEIAQSEAAFGVNPANYWVHNGFININKEKMSKSLKNFFTIKEILEKYKPEVVRLFLLSTHYRSPLDFSDEGLKEIKEKLDRFYEMLKKVNAISGKKKKEIKADQSTKENDIFSTVEKMEDNFKEAMNDDFNTALAIGNLFSTAREVNIYLSSIHNKNDSETGYILEKVKQSFYQIGNVLGIFVMDPDDYFHEASTLSVKEIEGFIKNRNEAKTAKDWKAADKIRDELYKSGIILQDTPSGVEWKSR